MSLISHAPKLFRRATTLKQAASISTTPTTLSYCPKGKCPLVKTIGCAARVRFDCIPKKKVRCPCNRLDVPEPSFSECLRCPPPPKRMSECQCLFSNDWMTRGPPKHCLKPNLGITIDGCNPRVHIKMLGSCRPRNLGCKKENKPCEKIKPGKCDPTIVPFRQACAAEFACTKSTKVSCRNECDPPKPVCPACKPPCENLRLMCDEVQPMCGLREQPDPCGCKKPVCKPKKGCVVVENGL